jgi:hypothetical protein
MKDKFITRRQAMELLHEHYDGLEMCSLEALEKALNEVLGVGSKRFERVKEVYLERLGEAAQSHMEEFRRQVSKRIGR